MDQNKNDAHEVVNKPGEEREKDNLYRVDEIIDQPQKKSSAWKWLLFIVLLLGLVVFAAYTPDLNRYFPDSTPSNSSNYQNSISQSYSSSQPNSDAVTNTAAVYGGLTLAIPIMIGALTLMTFINMAMFTSMSLNVGSIRSTLDDIRFDQNKK